LIWFEFHDPDLQYMASMMAGRQMRRIEIMPSKTTEYPLLAAKEAQELVPFFLNLDVKLKDKIRVALHRLNIAQRRGSLGDRAVDRCIALESLLGGSDNQEVTHKVTTRAARQLGGNDQDRVRKRDVVSLTYGFRSAMVHEGSEPKGMKKVAGEDRPVAEIIEAAAAICVDVIKLIMHKGKIPDWKLFDVQADQQ
jgi:hypothetical protein